MSFGFSIGDFISLTQLASRVVRDSRRACSAHDELTQEVSSLHTVLQRLEKETKKPESPLNRPGDSCQDELQSILTGCEKLLKTLETILNKYNALGQAERSGRKLWQRIRFGNGEMQDLADLRAKLVYYTSALSLFLNMVSVGTIGRVEKRMEEAGGDLREIKLAVNGITAHLLAGSKTEGSVLTAYADDDKAVWKEFRRELVSEGFSSATIHKHKNTIKAYVRELASRGLLDERDTYREDDEVLHDSSDAGEDSLPTPSCAPVQSDGAAGESPKSSPDKYSYHKSLSDSEASHHETDILSEFEIDLTPSINYTPEVEGDRFWTMGNIPIRFPKDDSCKVSKEGQIIENVPRPMLTSPFRENSIRCVSCLSNAFTVTIVMLPCGHQMCPICVRRLFRLSGSEPKYIPPHCCSEGNLPFRYGSFKYLDGFFKEWFQLPWKQHLEGDSKGLEYPCEADRQYFLLMQQDAVVSLYWPVADVWHPVFIVGPYGTCLLAYHWNLSTLLCKFRHWFGIIQNFLSEPRISTWQRDSLAPPDVLQGIETLRLLELDGVQLAGMDKIEAPDVADPILVHWNALNIFIEKFQPKNPGHPRGPSFQLIVERLDRWQHRSQRVCPDIISSVQQWVHKIERTDAIWDPANSADCTPRYTFGTGNNHSRNTSLQDAPTDTHLGRDLTRSSALTESRTFDDDPNFVFVSIAMARAVWRSLDRFSEYHSAERNLGKRLLYYQDEMEPRCVNYLVGPPRDARPREQVLRRLHEWVETDFLEKVDLSEIKEDKSLIYTTERRIEEAKCLVEKLKDGISSAKQSSGGTSQRRKGKRTK